MTAYPKKEEERERGEGREENMAPQFICLSAVGFLRRRASAWLGADTDGPTQRPDKVLRHFLLIKLNKPRLRADTGIQPHALGKR
jgi:hypothetical protein